MLAKHQNGKLVAKEMNKEATPDKEEEKERIINAGGQILRGRVEGSLNLSRCLGDHEYKDNPQLPAEEQKISPEPEIRMERLSPEETPFIIVACDGIWECLSAEQCVEGLRKCLLKGTEVSQPSNMKISDVVGNIFD